MTTHTRSVSNAWATALDSYARAQRSAGASTSTINSYSQRLRHLARSLQLDPDDITLDALLEWTGTQTWAPETRRGRYNAYRSFWAWGKHTKTVHRNVAKGLPAVKPGDVNPRPAPERVYRKAMMRATERERLWLELAHTMGLRRAEVAVIHSADVFEDMDALDDPDGAPVYSLLVHGKNDKTRVVPLTLSLANRLMALPSGYAFPGDDNGHLSPRWIGRRVTGLLDGDWTMHKLRHRAATEFYKSHGEFVAQELLGHASPATTRIYVKIPNERLRQAVLAAAS